MFWIVVAAMMAVVGSAIALPFLRGGATARPAAAFDLQVYRDQLREVDRDRAADLGVSHLRNSLTCRSQEKGSVM